MKYTRAKRPNLNLQLDRGIIFLIFIGAITSIIIARLFYFQVIRHDYFRQVAAKEHFGVSELPARRGDIFIKDYASNDKIRVATNSIYNLLYADPTKITDKKMVTDRIVPIIYNPEEARAIDNERVEKERKLAKTDVEFEQIKVPTDEELYKQFYDSILEKVSMDIKPRILIATNLNSTQIEGIKKLGNQGLEITAEGNLIAYPLKIYDKKQTAEQLSNFLDRAPAVIEKSLKGVNRYIVLQKRLPQEKSEEIKAIIKEDKTKNFSGLGLEEEYYRYYPEGTLAANLLGFLTAQNQGAYGIESSYNAELQGKKGIFQTQRDSIGRQITIGDTILEPAKDGANITLTIDRTIQLAAERRLAKGVQNYRATSGQLIIMNPKTGAIIAMAHYPTFDPNSYSNVYQKEIINLTPDQISKLTPVKGMENAYWHYRNEIEEDRFIVFKENYEDGKTVYKKYKNEVGPESYQNKAVSEPYEPGSVFKSIVMAIGIDDKDVTPSTRFTDPGFVEIELTPGVKKKITNVSSACTGNQSMTDVLANSCNTGMIYVVKKMGKSLFYSYMLKFGFDQKTDIEFDNEHPGKINHFNNWVESEFYNHAFGQGLTVTPIQMISALATIANKGIRMEPYIIDEIELEHGKPNKTTPKVAGTVISKETADLVTKMMVTAVESGVAKNAALKTHFVAAKTGTSQTVKNGKYVAGPGNTIASIGGFGPVKNPEWVMLVKLDRPRTNQYADATAGIIFREMAEFLYDYYSTPPDKK